jgi:hypothetical protein
MFRAWVFLKWLKMVLSWLLWFGPLFEAWDPNETRNGLEGQNENKYHYGFGSKSVFSSDCPNKVVAGDF